jgi:dihydrofolate synthase/folylpolyglutamate synthase
MNYNQTIDWMFSQLPMYQNIGKSAYKNDIGNIVEACRYLNQPQQKFKSVHIAGTNGKGSTSHMMASILQEAGYKVGLYTSPHLKDFRERIRINGKKIEKKYVIEFVELHQPFFKNQKASFFEMTVALAFDYFANSKIDIAIIETGLGGRLDSTNIITPELSVITNISLDHANLLGNSLERIAMEKAGIIKKNIPLVIGRKQKEIQFIFDKVSDQMSAPLTFAKDYQYKSDLKGFYQTENINTAVQACLQLISRGWVISNKHIELGLLNVMRNTKLQARWQKLNNKPLTICDTGHNLEGIAFIVEQIKTINYKQLHFVLGMVNDKNENKILNLLPKDGYYYFCKPNIARGLGVEKLFLKASNYQLKGEKFDSVNLAYEQAKKEAKPEDLIFIGGSTFVAAEVL